MNRREMLELQRIKSLAETERRVGGELAWIVVACIAACALAIQFEVPERALVRAEQLDGWNYNGLLALLLVAPIGAVVFAYRRYGDARQAQIQLARLSLHDSLTLLPNRRFLDDGLRSMLDAGRRSNRRTAVFFVDLDKFKTVNDTYGHEAGDRLMRAVADRLRATVKEEDGVVRYAGDEFVLVLNDIPTVEVAERVAARLVKVIETPFEMGQDRIRISASIGIALTDGTDADPEDVVRDADAAMYQAKLHAGSGGSFATFDRSMRERLTPSTAERRLRLALEQSEFRLYYQPIVSLWTKRLVGVEALIRWEDPSRGLVRPDEFLPALEETGLIVPVGRWVIDEVCRQSRIWSDRYPERPPLGLMANVSSRQLAQSDFAEQLAASLSASGADPSSLYLELPELSLVSDASLVWATLRGAKRLGVRLALDHFGSELSSIGFLRRFEFDLLKLDQSYVFGLGHDRQDTDVATHIVSLAKSLDIVTLALGVETEAQVEHLRATGCDLAQGYLFSTPQPPNLIDHLLAQPTLQGEWRPVGEPTGDAAVVRPSFDPAAPTS